MKRRKTRTASEAGTSPQEKKSLKSPSVGKSSVAASIPAVNIDDFEAEKGNAATDVMSYHTACEEIKKLIEEVNDLKGEGNKPTCSEITERRIRCTLLFIVLKKLNRLAHIRCKKARDTTQEAKQKVDSLHLQLQNLLYEAMHLKKEIMKCLEFKSKDEEIELVSEEEFYEEAPKEISKPDVTKDEPHQRMLARLDWELEQRKRFASQKEDLLKRQDNLVQEIQTKKKFLYSLQPRLESILKSTHPVQEYLNLPLDALRAQHETARFLPQPLYVLYVQATAYHEACDKHLDVQILGDLDAAKAALEEKPARPAEEESDSDDEVRDKPRKSRRRRKKEESRQAENRKALLKTHPLQITLQVHCRGKISLSLLFSYIPALHIVTVKSSLTIPESVDQPVLTDSTLLSPESLLTCLFPCDYGNTTPNTTNQYLLAKEGIENFSSCVKQVGRPFLWAQRICGLEFLPDSKEPVTAEPPVSSSHMEATIKAIKARVVARLALQKQLSSLEKLQVPVTDHSAEVFPHKITSTLTSWSPVPYADFVAMPHSRTLVTEGLIDESDMFFSADIERNKVQLKAGVVIYQEYPVKPPVICLSVLCDGAVVSDDIARMMEAEVNVHYQDLLKHDSPVNILANQLKRLQMCFDIFLECGSLENIREVESPECKKLLIRKKRGRDRCLPFQYDATHGIFSHR